MFKAEQIREYLTAKDFVPFRLHLSDGATYDIPSRDHAMVSQNFVEVGVNPNAKGIVQRIVRCALVHITQIEELQTA
jgi:hypothetical protein